MKRPNAKVESPGNPTRNYLNDSGLDYNESKELPCAQCGKQFESSRLVWDGTPSGDFDTICPKCVRDNGMAAEREFHRKVRAGLIPGLQPELTDFPLPPDGSEGETHFPDRWMTAHDLEAMGDRRRMQRVIHECALGGDEVAVDLLFRQAWDSVMALNNLAQCRPELVRPYSRKEVMWPGFIGKGAKRKLKDWLVIQLELGKESTYRGSWHPEAPSTKTAVVMDGWLKENRDLLGLPPLTQSTRDAWFAKGWEALLKATNGRPDRHPFFAQLGNSAVKQTGKDTADRRGMPSQTEGMKRDDVIAKIKEMLRKAFFTYTKNAPQ